MNSSMNYFSENVENYSKASFQEYCVRRRLSLFEIGFKTIYAKGYLSLSFPVHYLY